MRISSNGPKDLEIRVMEAIVQRVRDGTCVFRIVCVGWMATIQRRWFAAAFMQGLRQKVRSAVYNRCPCRSTAPTLRVLGIESSCDETGVALYDSAARRLLGQALYSQVEMHQAFGGVVPELASRDHICRALPLLKEVLRQADCGADSIDAIAYTQGPGLAGALLVGTGLANGLALGLEKPVLGIHHLEGHLLSPLLSSSPPDFPFVALLVSGGHTQLMRVDGVGVYALLGETVDDAAGEAFDKTAKLLGLTYPGGPALAELALLGTEGAHTLPRPMLHSGNLDFSFSGLKTAALTAVRNYSEGTIPAQARADIALAFETAVVDVLIAKSLAALKVTGARRLIVAGGVGANAELRRRLRHSISSYGGAVYFPELQWCTDNGAMIALAGALRLDSGIQQASFNYGFTVRPRWELAELAEPVKSA